MGVRYHLDGLVVDPVSGRLEKDGELLSLQPLPWQLLLLLCEHPDRLFSREELTAHLWPDVFVSEDSLTQVIRRLRRAAGEDLVETVPRRGYRLGRPVRRASGEQSAPEAAAPIVARAPSDRFVGRATELAEIERALDGEDRLITLFGPGGIGKTRLARELWAKHADRSLWVELGGASTAEDVALRVTEALGIHAGDDALSSASAALARQDLSLLVLDELDLAVAAAPETVSVWLAGIPGLRILTTSREVLDVPGERTIRIDPLPEDDATALFLARSDVEVPPDQLSEAVRAVEGVPLAVELLANRSRIAPLPVLLAQIRDRRALHRRHASGRHASVDAALDASWERLGPTERANLVRLALFEEGFGWEDASAVVQPPEEVLDIVQDLVDRSWLRAEPSQGRLSLLGLVRSYVRDRADPTSLDDAVTRHGQWFARLGARERLDRIRHDPLVYEQNAAALPDLVAACRRAASRGDAEVAVGAALAAQPVLHRRGPQRLLRELLESVEPLAHGARRSAILLTLSTTASSAMQHEQALAYADACLANARAERDRRTEGTALMVAARVLATLTRSDEARARLTDAIAVLREQEHWYNLGIALQELAGLAEEQGELEEALVLATEAVEIYRLRGVAHAEGNARRVRAFVALRAHRLAEVRADLTVALECARLSDDLSLQARVFTLASKLAEAEGDTEEEIAAGRRAIELYEALGWEGFAANERSNLSEPLLTAGLLEEADRMLVSALAQQERDGDRDGQVLTLVRLAKLRVAEGDLAAALMLHERTLSDRTGVDPSVVAIALIERAATRSAVGDLDSARADLEEADHTGISGRYVNVRQRRDEVAEQIARA